MSSFDKFKRHLKPGQVYRREELVRWSTAIDRHLRKLVDEGVLIKLAGGLYAYPKRTAFGNAPVDDDKMVEAFLRDRRFLFVSPNAYNSLGVGTTQLYNTTIVYNHKRHGDFSLGGRRFAFRVKPSFPKALSKEFLLVDLVNNLDQIAESETGVLDRVKRRLSSLDASRIRRAVRDYGNLRAKKFFAQALAASNYGG
jgi:hypothetical protein